MPPLSSYSSILILLLNIHFILPFIWPLPLTRVFIHLSSSCFTPDIDLTHFVPLCLNPSLFLHSFHLYSSYSYFSLYFSLTFKSSFFLSPSPWVILVFTLSSSSIFSSPSTFTPQQPGDRGKKHCDKPQDTVKTSPNPPFQSDVTVPSQ